MTEIYRLAAILVTDAACHSRLIRADEEGMSETQGQGGRPAHETLERAFAELTDGAPGESTTPRSRGAHWSRRAFGRVVRLRELCERPVAAAGYLALAKHFVAVIVEGIPRLGREQRDAARRFNIILVIALDDARTLLIASAEGPPEEIYAAGDGIFAFRRTVSRLIVTQNEDYIANRSWR